MRSDRYDICLHWVDDPDGGYYLAWHPEFGRSACSFIDDTVMGAIRGLAAVRRDVVAYYKQTGKEVPRRRILEGID